MSIGGSTPPSTPLACRAQGDALHTPSPPIHPATPGGGALVKPTEMQHRTFGVNVTNAVATPSAMDKSIAHHTSVATRSPCGTPPVREPLRSSRSQSNSTPKRSRSASLQTQVPRYETESDEVAVGRSPDEIEFATDPSLRRWRPDQGGVDDAEQHFPAALAAMPSFKIVATAQQYARERVLFAVEAAKNTAPLSDEGMVDPIALQLVDDTVWLSDAMLSDLAAMSSRLDAIDGAGSGCGGDL